MENIFNPRQLPGNIIGGVIGFCQGEFIGVMLLLLIPVLAPGGVAIDRFIGNMLTRAK